MKKNLILLSIFSFSVLAYVPGNDRERTFDTIKSHNGDEVTIDDALVVNETLDVTGETTLKTTLDGPLKASSGLVSSSPVDLATSEVTGVLPVANGGTNSSTTLTNDKIMYSSAGQIIESTINPIDVVLQQRTINTTAPIQGGGDLSADRTFSMTQSNTTTDGWLSSTDWNTFNDKQPAITGTDGDLYFWNSGLFTNLGIGTTGQLLSVSALGFPEWADPVPSTSLTTKGQIQGFSTVNANVGPCVDDQILVYDDLEATGWKCSDFPSVSPTTTLGDIIVRGATEDERLPVGTNGQLLTIVGGVPQYADAPVSTTNTLKGDIQSHDGVSNASLAVGTDGQMLYADSSETTGLRWGDQPISTTVSQKGDIQTHDGAANASLAVGSNGQFLMADSDETTGIRWYDGITTTDWDDTPVGTILAYGSLTAPTGYAIADGSCLDKAVYGSLFEVLGTTNGECDAGSGVGSGFNIPDLRGKFIRGVDDGAGNDPNAATRVACATGGATGDSPGTCESDATAVNGLATTTTGSSHTHRLSIRGVTASGSNAAGTASLMNNTPTGTAVTMNANNFANTTDSTHTHGLTGDQESRPTNVSMVYIIKVQGREPITSVAQKSMSPDKAGFIIWSAFDGNVEGHLKADGSCVLKTDWPDYVKNVGLTTFGECTITTTNDGVLLPDLVTDNRFIRAAGGSLAVGTTQTDQNASHSHMSSNNSAGARIAFYATANATGTPGVNNSNVWTGSGGVAAITGLSGGTESRPNNMALVPYVRMVDRDTIYGNFDQIEEVTAPLGVNDHNTYSATLNASTCAVESENVSGWIDSSTSVGSDICSINFAGLGLTVAPVPMDTSSFISSGVHGTAIGTPTTTAASVYCINTGTGVVANGCSKLYIQITKQAPDFITDVKGRVVKEKAVQGFQIGDCKMSLLDTTAFNQLHTGSWVRMEGQSIAGSQLETIGGFSTMPDAVSNGAFFRQVGGNSGALRAYQADDNKSHTHTQIIDASTGTSTAYLGESTRASTSPDYTLTNINASGGVEARPKNFAMNFYCRID